MQAAPSSAAKPFHHGDLARALVDKGLAIALGPTGGVASLRGVATAEGVTPMAAYRHFPNKDAYLDAVAQAGLRLLGQTQADAIADIADPRERFVELGLSFVRFAQRNPALFHLIFSRPVGTFEPTERNDPASQLLRDVLLDLHVTSSQLAERMTFAWALVHGLASLAIGGRIPSETEHLVNCLRMAKVAVAAQSPDA